VNDRNAISELLARVSNYDSSPDDNRLEAGERGQLTKWPLECKNLSMRATLKGLEFDVDPRSLPANPEEFSFLLRVLIGPADREGADIFDLIVCSPEWLSKKCRTEGFFPGFHHLIVTFEHYDERRPEKYLETWASRQEGGSWEEIVQNLRLLGRWEFEGYR
jgi:hypothetical protein